MRLAALALCALLLALPLRAEETPATPDTAVGYAFAYPRLLVQQQLFGIANAIALLAAACREEPDAARAAEEAYGVWRNQQAAAIAAAVADLDHYYFGAATGSWPALAHVLQLKTTLDYPPHSATLTAACATLAEALSKPRYDLAALFAREEAMTVVNADLEASIRHDRCRRLFSDAERRLLEARYEVWREINAPLSQKARDTLERTWPADATPTFAAWLAQQRRALRIGASHADCLEFSAALKQPETSLRHAFRRPPSLHRETTE